VSISNVVHNAAAWRSVDIKCFFLYLNLRLVGAVSYIRLFIVIILLATIRLAIF